MIGPVCLEQDLIQLTNQGNEEAFRLIAERYKNLLFGTAFLILKDHHMTEDVIQETMLKLFKRCHHPVTPGPGRHLKQNGKNYPAKDIVQPAGSHAI